MNTKKNGTPIATNGKGKAGKTTVEKKLVANGHLDDDASSSSSKNSKGVVGRKAVNKKDNNVDNNDVEMRVESEVGANPSVNSVVNAAADSTTNMVLDKDIAAKPKAAKGKGKTAAATAKPADATAKGGKQKRKAAENSEDGSKSAANKQRGKAAATTSSAAASASGDAAATGGAKRRGKSTGTSLEPPGKKLKLWIGHSDGGVVLTVGQGDTGQLGLGEDTLEKTRPAVVDKIPEKCQQICAGGMHTVCVTVSGEVYTFGCNDEGALGRKTEEEEACMEPGKVEVGEKVVMVSAGDSHTAALTLTHRVFIWGVFRDSSGAVGMANGVTKFECPTLLDATPPGVVKICSGNDHLVLLTDAGQIFTLGSAEQGQLGRVGECFTARGGRRGPDLLLKPARVHFSKKNTFFSDVWAGQYVTFAKELNNGDIYAWGLNNYLQLGVEDTNARYMPEKVKNFDPAKNWKCFSSGQHHTLALDKQGLVYSIGRKDYGRLGLGPIADIEESAKPQLIKALAHIQCVDVSCGSTSSFCIDNKGVVYSWGMGSELLGQGADVEDIDEPQQIKSQQLQNRRGVMVSAGGQHTVFLASDVQQ